MKNEDFLKYIKDNFDGLKRFEVNTDFYMSTDSTTSKTYLVLEKGDFYDSLGDTKFYRYAPSYALAQKLAKDLDKPLVAREGGYGTDYVNNINITDRDDIKMVKPSDSWLDYETSYFPYAGLIIYEYHKGDGTLSLAEKPIISEEERYRAIGTPLSVPLPPSISDCAFLRSLIRKFRNFTSLWTTSLNSLNVTSSSRNIFNQILFFFSPIFILKQLLKRF